MGVVTEAPIEILETTRVAPTATAKASSPTCVGRDQLLRETKSQVHHPGHNRSGGTEGLENQNECTRPPLVTARY